jgi:L-asparaginase
MKNIHFILTGGTINKVYNPSTEKPEITDQPVIAHYLEHAVKPDAQLSFYTVCLKDSLEITPQDRDDILRAVQNSSAKNIIITHGTSTMTDTLEFLHGKTGDKTVVLMGAMVPLKEFTMSDGGFNLGYAMAQVQSLEAGVYICMNASTFEAGKVQKDVRAARFVSR